MVAAATVVVETVDLLALSDQPVPWDLVVAEGKWAVPVLKVTKVT